MDLDGVYHVWDNCCHIAQESVRLYYGLTHAGRLDYPDLAVSKVIRLKALE